jgi:HK97 gp10 family phage protein
MQTIIGLDKLQKQLSEIPGILENKHALLMGAFVLQRFSMINAPVKTGFLRGSMISRETDKGAEMEVGAEYAGYVEFGTAKWTGKPYVRPAIEEHSTEIVKAVKDEVDKGLKKL